MDNGAAAGSGGPEAGQCNLEEDAAMPWGDGSDVTPPVPADVTDPAAEDTE